MGKDRFGLVGQTIAGTFRVDQVVAEGGFGIVYRAFHVHFRSAIALKCLKIPAELGQEERASFLEQFRSEAEILFHLSSSLPNIVRPLHVDAVQTPSGDFVPLMALEWLEGKTFERLIEERAMSGTAPMSLDEAVTLLGPVARALEAAHAFEIFGSRLSIIHRDIKPDNLFLCRVGAVDMVKILDFGISKMKKAANDVSGLFTQTSGQAPFSPAYGSPEQWAPKRFGPTGPWTDVWGLALTLVEIIKGAPVIVGDHQAMMGTAIDPKVRPTPRSEGVEVVDEVEAVFHKALSVEPRYRYQTVGDFWSCLEGAMRTYGASSQSRIRVEPLGAHLPKMSAPTPWTAPISRGPELSAQVSAWATTGADLPPMLAPPPLEWEAEEPAAFEASYPNDPMSGLAPVPPAPISQRFEDLYVPPLDEGSLPPRVHVAEKESGSHARRTTSTRPIANDSFTLELQPISVLPPPGSEPPRLPPPFGGGQGERKSSAKR